MDNLYGIDPATMAMGIHAVHVPLALIQQDCGEKNKFCGVFQFEHPGGNKLFKTQKDESPHVLMIGDAIIRPRIVMHSSHLVGQGISGVYRDGFSPEEWAQGEIKFTLD